MSLSNDIRAPFKSGNVLMQIIIVNIAVFLLLHIIRLCMFFAGYSEVALQYQFGRLVYNVAMPQNIHLFLDKPWTLFTYFFAHVEIFHLLFNMLFLYFIGSVLQEFLGNSRTLAIYVYAGVMGGLISLLAYSSIPALQPHSLVPLIGASGGVMGVVLAATTLVPNKKIYLYGIVELRLVYLTLFYVAVDLIGISTSDGIGHICHLGGALTGFLFIRLLKKGTDLSRPFNCLFYGTRNIFRPKKRQPRMKVVKNKKGGNEYVTAMGRDTGTTESKIQIQRRIDAILDKISRGGYESLSKEEKDYLFTHGKDV